MAKRPGAADEGMLISPTLLEDFSNEANIGDVNMDYMDGGGDELSLEEILTLYSQPINEEQAWAVCYQCCWSLAQKHRRRNSKSAEAPIGDYGRKIDGPGDVRILKDGTIKLQHQNTQGKKNNGNDWNKTVLGQGVWAFCWATVQQKCRLLHLNVHYYALVFKLVRYNIM